MSIFISDVGASIFAIAILGCLVFGWSPKKPATLALWLVVFAFLNGLAGILILIAAIDCNGIVMMHPCIDLSSPINYELLTGISICMILFWLYRLAASLQILPYYAGTDTEEHLID